MGINYGINVMRKLGLSVLFLILCVSKHALAGASADPQALALPDDCAKYDEQRIRCVVKKLNIASGFGGEFAQDYTLITSEAPSGYKLEWSEGHVGADNPVGDKKKHTCGVRDEGTPQPSGIVGNDGPKEQIGHRAGESLWAKCYILERDARHVIMGFNIQGVIKPSRNLIKGGATTPADRVTIYGNAEVIAVYVRSP